MDLKIYFCGSIHGGREDAELYSDIIKDLKSNYGQVLTEFVGHKDAGKLEQKEDPRVLHAKTLQFLQECDVLVAEVTQPSLGVGYEIGRAVTLGKKILCLFRPDSGKNLSCMIKGLDTLEDDHQVTVKYYTDKQYRPVLEEFFHNFKS